MSTSSSPFSQCEGTRGGMPAWPNKCSSESLKHCQIARSPSPSASPLNRTTQSSQAATDRHYILSLTSMSNLSMAEGGLTLPALRGHTQRSPSDASSSAYDAEGRSSSGSTAVTSPGRDLTPAASDEEEGDEEELPLHVVNIGSTGVVGGDRSSGQLRYRLEVIQQPVRGSAHGWPESALGRLPIVPAIVLRLTATDQDGREVPMSQIPTTLVCTANLIPSDLSDRTSLDTIVRRRQDAPHLSETRVTLVGRMQASATICLPPGGGLVEEVYFVFSDLAVRVEGSFRLRFSLVNAVPTGPNGVDAEVAEAVSDIFEVVQFSDYPGQLTIATDLSRYLVDQGAGMYLPRFEHGSEL